MLYLPGLVFIHKFVSESSGFDTHIVKGLRTRLYLYKKIIVDKNGRLKGV